jgi:hypothetical protein
MTPGRPHPQPGRRILLVLAGATGFGPQTTTLALVLLPVVLLLGIATYARLVQINTQGFQLVLAMNRLRRAYLTIAPALEPYFTTGHHDDERGLVTTYMLHRPTQLRLWLHFLVNTPTIVATVDAALATVIVVLLLKVAEAPRVALVAGGGPGVPGGVGNAVLPPAAHPATAPGHDAQVPHPAEGTPVALAAHASPGHRRCAGSLGPGSPRSVAVLRNRSISEATSCGSSEIGTWLRPGSHRIWAWRTKARNRGLCMLTNGSAVPCRKRTGQVMRSSRVGTSNMAAWTVSRYPGAWAKSNSSCRASAAGNCQGRLRSMAKNRDRPALVAASWVALGASSLARARPLTRAAA